MKTKKMKARRILVSTIAALMALGSMYLFLIPLASANGGIPEQYYQDLDINKSYTYNVTQFDSKLNWWDLNWANQGWVNCNIGGQIVVNFTGFHAKHANDASPFQSPVPYINISFYENQSGFLILNRTMFNVSSYEASNQLAIGYNEFDPGFLIEINDMNTLKQQALAQNTAGFWSANVEVTEYFHLMKFCFEQNSKGQNTTVIYDKRTGLLVWAKVENTYGPDIEMSLDGYELDLTELNPDYSNDVDYFSSLVYNVSKFDSKLNWWDLNWVDQGWVNCNVGGQIIVNFTGFHAKHSNDNSPFSAPTPYINISFHENQSGSLVLNRTMVNVSSYEASNQLAIGYNEFDLGFLIPVNDFTTLKQQALAQNTAGFWAADIIIEEKVSMIQFEFKQHSKAQNTTILFDKSTGVLISANVENSYGPDIKMQLVGYQYDHREYNEHYYDALSSSYTYNVSQFDDKLGWWDLNWQYQGDVRSNKGGQLIVNITGYYEKHSNDNSPFSNPVPYINLSFHENQSGSLVLNRTMYNVSSYEACNSLAIGYNEFDPGFFIPIGDLEQQALAQNTTGFWAANVTVLEYDLMVEFRFYQDSKNQNTTIIYDRATGVLVWARVENNFGPDIIMFLLGYELNFTITVPPLTPITPLTTTTTPLSGLLPGITVVIIVGVAGLITVIYLIIKKKTNK